MTHSIPARAFRSPELPGGLTEANRYSTKVTAITKIIEATPQTKTHLEAVKAELIVDICTSDYLTYNLLTGGLNGALTQLMVEKKLDSYTKPTRGELWFFTTHLINGYRETVQSTRKEIQALPSKPKIASIACGALFDVLGARTDGQVHGFDRDPGAKHWIDKNVKHYGFKGTWSFTEQEASKPLTVKECDAIVANGFSIYLEDQELEAVFKNAAQALKKGGSLLCSFITPPNTWDLSKIPERDLTKLGLYMGAYVNKAGWMNYRTPTQISAIAKKCGLSPTIIKDTRGIHPLLKATK